MSPECSLPQRETEVSSVSLPYWNLKISVLQVDCGNPVTSEDGLTDPRYSQHLAMQGPQKCVESPQVQNLSQPPIPFGDEKVTGKNTSLLIGLRHHSDGSFRQESVDFHSQNPSVL